MRKKSQLMAVAAIGILFVAGLAVGHAITSGGSGHSGAPPPARRIVAAPSALAPLSPKAFRAPVAEYRRYVVVQLRELAREVAQMRVALASGLRGRARAAWRGAYASYGRVGAAYGAFGALDRAIDGTPDGLPGGFRNPRFRGLHRIERGLWSGAPLVRTAPWAALLARDVARLQVRARRLTINPLEYATRAHEILEMAKRDQLGGRVVTTSGEGVLGLAAAVDATGEVLHTLRDLLAGRAGAQQPAQGALVRLRAQLRLVHDAHHGYPPLAALAHRERALLTARTDAALEALAHIPEALETMPTRMPPAIGSEHE